MTTLGELPTKQQSKISPKTVLLILHIVLGLAIVSAIAGGYVVVNRYIDLQKKASTLRSLSIYSDAKRGVQQVQLLKDLEKMTTIDEVVTADITMANQFQSTTQYYNGLQQPYQYFLQYFLLPPLNIWKNKYTGKIDDSLIGQKYLQDNNYLDVNLISQRTNFFKNIGQDSPKNDIKSITVGSINEQDGGIFTIPVDVDFVAQTKRSFLLLVDKLSLTSNRSNISLLNEFFFNLRLVLKDKAIAQSPASDDQASSGSSTSGSNVPVVDNAKIGQQLYNWVYDSSNSYLSNDDIVEAIKRTANCESEAQDVCYFKFREKMRSVPALAYTVGLENSNKSRELRGFIQAMPPMINVKSFTFQKQVAGQSTDGSRGYEGKLSIEVYGKSMTAEDVGQISQYLGAQCTNNQALTPETALAQLDNVIKQATSVTDISNEKSKQLTDLREAFQNINTSYGSLPGFKKAVKLFEIYRMLLDNRLCVKK